MTRKNIENVMEYMDMEVDMASTVGLDRLEVDDFVCVSTVRGRVLALGYVTQLFDDSIEIQNADENYNIGVTDDIESQQMTPSMDGDLDTDDGEDDSDEFVGEAKDDAKSVDMDKLPKTVRDKVTGTTKLTDEQVEKIANDVGDAALEALKKVGVKATEIYGMVDMIQKAILEVFKT
jgi:hypothetical protein